VINSGTLESHMAQSDVLQLHDKLTVAINTTTPEARAQHDSLFAPDFIYVSYPPGFTVPAKDIPDLSLENLHTAASGRTVFSESVLSGTYSGATQWHGAMAGARFQLRVCTVTTFNDAGLVARRALYWDPETLKAQLSNQRALPAKPAGIRYSLSADETALLAEFAAGGGAEYGYR
jgi:hypothetical protein